MLIKKYDYNCCFKRIRQDVGSIKIEMNDKRSKWTECVISKTEKCENRSESVKPPFTQLSKVNELQFCEKKPTTDLLQFVFQQNY